MLTVISCVTALLCVAMICATVLVSVEKIFYRAEKQESITQQDLDKAYEDMNKDGDKVPDFMNVIDYINKEFGGIEDE